MSETEVTKGVQRFRKKPVEIEAMQWDGSRSSIEACCRWVNSYDEEGEPTLSYTFMGADDVSDVRIWESEGERGVSAGDWLVLGADGLFRLCPRDTFEQTYEAAPDPSSERLTLWRLAPDMPWNSTSPPPSRPNLEMVEVAPVTPSVEEIPDVR